MSQEEMSLDTSNYFSGEFFLSRNWPLLRHVLLDRLMVFFLFYWQNRKEGLIFNTTAEFEVVKTMKEQICHLSNTSQR
jgi:hypothetical protein